MNYICLTCSESENIPLNVVRDFDRMDQGDRAVPPQFTCESCGGAMYPEYYKGIHGYEYRVSDRLENKEVEGNSK
ncbi:hypothetical protein GC102_06955 [Paenibacillus sp. LMG 31460]|uniref:Phage protein n=1 Tax=Paenibacillus germinis TaxID=2654979 RepID=A0ABX1YWL9_9BACL|nr:hypothetical protein [Paenibacillus germinis]